MELHDGNLDHACQLAADAADQLHRVGYATGAGRLREFRVSLDPWKTTIPVRTLDDNSPPFNSLINLPRPRKDTPPMSPVRAVWFDVGEVLIINETREYGTWADWLGIPRHTFSAMFGAVIARRQDYRL